jgi:hypothetical protein
MRNSRPAGLALLIGALLPPLILGLHPSAHDLAADASGHVRAVNYLVHGIAVAAQPLVLLGLIGLSQYLGWSALSTGALVVYSFAVVGNLVAALMSGFVASDVIAQLPTGDPAVAGPNQVLLHYTGLMNQAFAKMAVVAAGMAILLWSLAIGRTRLLSRLSAVLGLAVGLLLVLGILLGQAHLNVRGIIVATAMQAIWMALVAIQLQRLPPEAHG